MRYFVRISAISLLLFLLVGCSTVPITGRRQLQVIPRETIMAQSAAGYQAVIEEGPLSTDQTQVEQVRRVGERISAAVERYFRERGEMEVLDGFDWTFNVIQNDTPNAWCMPGGKVVFYTGIFPYTRDEAGIAVVMGHEIAHAVAGHGTERVSHQLLQQGGGIFTSWMLEDSDYHDALMMVYGLGTTVGGILPFSRLHESEADRMGLIFMAMAGYDPAAAIPFWERMQQSGGGSPPEFLSTHPSGDTRISRLREYLSEARTHYRP